MKNRYLVPLLTLTLAACAPSNDLFDVDLPQVDHKNLGKPFASMTILVVS